MTKSGAKFKKRGRQRGHMGAGLFREAAINDLLSNMSYDCTLVRVPGVVRGATKLGDDWFVAMLGYEAMAGLPHASEKSPEWLKRMNKNYRRTGLPVFGKVQNADQLERVLCALEYSARERTPAACKGKYTLPLQRIGSLYCAGKNTLGYLQLRQLELDENYITGFLEDGDLTDTDQKLLTVWFENLDNSYRTSS
jgi:hypothetical protein